MFPHILKRSNIRSALLYTFHYALFNPSKSIIPWTYECPFTTVWQGDLACLERHLEIKVLSLLLLALL